jgi:hypothetical protein
VNNSPGTLTVVGTISLAEAFQNVTVHVVKHSQSREHGHSQTSLVLRC